MLHMECTNVQGYFCVFVADVAFFHNGILYKLMTGYTAKENP